MTPNGESKAAWVQRTRLAGVALCGVVLLLVLAVQPANGQTQCDPANCCLGHYISGVCTANDLPDQTYYSLIDEDACMFPNDTAEVELIIEADPGSPDRYDMSWFIALDGESANKDDDTCYHGYLDRPLVDCSHASFNQGICSPTYDAGTTGPPPRGGTSFWNAETSTDVCGDVEGGSPYSPPVRTLYHTESMTFRCIDVNGDRVVEPINVCVGWDNNRANTCTGIDTAYPGTPSKCQCYTVEFEPPLIIYPGMDFGDLSAPYNRTLMLDNGARHAIQETTGDYIPDTLAGVPAVWLGSYVDMEADGMPCPICGLDDATVIDDEDGVAPVGKWLPGHHGGRLEALVSTSEGVCSNCYLAFWIDWNGDLAFDGEHEAYGASVQAGANIIPIDLPDVWPDLQVVDSRFRLYDRAQLSYSPVGLVRNGEVEDYQIDLDALVVALADFSFTCQGSNPLIRWETVSEIDTMGFNLWRSTSPGVPEEQLNRSLIPAQGPGTVQGFAYTWLDETAVPGTTYFYWLEDISLAGAAHMTGPLEALCTSPTAVTVSRMSSTQLPILPLPPLGAVPGAALLAFALATRARRRTG